MPVGEGRGGGRGLPKPYDVIICVYIYWGGGGEWRWMEGANKNVSHFRPAHLAWPRPLLHAPPSFLAPPAALSLLPCSGPGCGGAFPVLRHHRATPRNGSAGVVAKRCAFPPRCYATANQRSPFQQPISGRPSTVVAMATAPAYPDEVPNRRRSNPDFWGEFGAFRGFILFFIAPK